MEKYKVLEIEGGSKSKHLLVDSRVEDLEFVDSDVSFFPKIRVLWIQAQNLFIFWVTIVLLPRLRQPL
ncbi:unnamed protein product [Spirodela intermedia]|uniref:Uncharacterized protein n=1 Tax=Spirodela intermedia TaxID=51605 RepID=A0A7I8KBJ7_SPIIN|nr:unnamed protein product [Spirodela intermedia]